MDGSTSGRGRESGLREEELGMMMVWAEVSSGLNICCYRADSNDGSFYLCKEMVTWPLEDIRPT